MVSRYYVVKKQHERSVVRRGLREPRANPEELRSGSGRSPVMHAQRTALPRARSGDPRPGASPNSPPPGSVSGRNSLPYMSGSRGGQRHGRSKKSARFFFHHGGLVGSI
jgi:hypothetical protein